MERVYCAPAGTAFHTATVLRDVWIIDFFACYLNPAGRDYMKELRELVMSFSTGEIPF